MTSKDNKGRLHLAMGYVATAGLAALFVPFLTDVPKVLATVAAVMVLLAIVIMFTTRKSDEYIASLWTSGASAGFIAAMAWLILLPFLEGFYDGLTGGNGVQDIPAEGASIVALVGFVLAHNIKRIRGF